VRIVLIFNPASGGGRPGRGGTIGRVEEALVEMGHAVEVLRTREAGSAGVQARDAVESGAELVFACGGDGTVHEVLQGVVGMPHVALGIVPMGSANALARNLGLSLDPVEAASQQMRGDAVSISLGKVEFEGGSRCFAVMAGAGPDGALVYELAARMKSGWGRFAYDAHALRVFLTRRFRPFVVEYRSIGSDETTTAEAICAMAVRVGSLGGIFWRLTGRKGAMGGMRLVLVRPPGWLSLPVWFVLGWLGLEKLNPLVRSAEVSEFSCYPMRGSTPHIEADGEWLGRLPMRVTLAMDALRILRPAPDAGEK
jgi:diacylglycerol kinase (ATP)